MPTTYPSLFLLTRGKALPQPSEHLLRDSTDQFLREIYHQYEYIIIDSSPVLAADDTTSLVPKIDATLLVVLLSYTLARLTKKARVTLQSSGQCARNNPELCRYFAAGVLLLPVFRILQPANRSARIRSSRATSNGQA
jgi:hypothetical protein